MSTDATADRARRALWPLRIVWLTVPFTVGAAGADALDGRDDAVVAVASGMAWLAWGAVLVASLVPRSMSLTVVRMIAPGAVPAAVWAAVVSDDATTAVIGVVGAVVAVATALVGPGVSDAFVDGSSYGDERRVALRIPTGLLAAPVPVAWAAATAGAVAGPLLLAAGTWVAGAAAAAIGAVVVAVVTRRIHVLSRRWLVFVPAGVVVHDPLHLGEPQLFPRTSLRRFGPVAEVGDAVDVTGGAPGLVLEVRPTEPVDVGLRRGRAVEETPGVPALLVAPVAPGAAMDVARARRLPTG